jgi:hypothetical protein
VWHRQWIDQVRLGLLGPQAISGVISELEAFKALGVKGVTVDVSFPLLLLSTPDSSRYLSFYEQVAEQARSRQMVLSVKENPVFSGTPLTSLSISYSGLTLASYAAEQREEAQVIIDHLSPSYLSLLTEPDTFSDTLGIDLDTPAAAVELRVPQLVGTPGEGRLVEGLPYGARLRRGRSPSPLRWLPGHRRLAPPLRNCWVRQAEHRGCA